MNVWHKMIVVFTVLGLVHMIPSIAAPLELAVYNTPGTTTANPDRRRTSGASIVLESTGQIDEPTIPTIPTVTVVNGIPTNSIVSGHPVLVTPQSAPILK